MDNKTQLNRSVNATVLNTQTDNNPTVLNLQTGDAQTDAAGERLGGRYLIESKMNVSTGEADLYICTDGRERYVAKIYRRKMAIKEEVTEKLMAVDSPYVARLYATGEYKGFHYEIIPYYKNGSLEGRTFGFRQLKTEIIPALNEGLKVLHDNDIIHKDLKPSNIMLADNGRDVAIIDFGISSVREDGNTVIVTRTGMTPEYSAPETFKSLFLTESDYYSLGVTLFQLYCGHTPYANMDQDEIEQFVSVQKLPLPQDMEEELKVLISALTYPDITNRKNKSNPNRRWGYEEILKWCVGIKQPVPGEVTGGAAVSGDIRPYKFLGNTYTDKKKLIYALTDNWKEGKKQLFRGLLSAYFKNFDQEIAGFCMDGEEEASNEDEDLIFFKTLYKIDSTLTEFLWKGHRYEDLADLGGKFLDCLRNSDSSMDNLMSELLKKGVLSQYILSIDEKEIDRAKSVKVLESNYRVFRDDSGKTLANYYRLAYMLSGNKTLWKYDTGFTTVEELTSFLRKSLDRSYDEFEKMCHELIDYSWNLDPQFEGWLISLGKAKELKQWRSSL